MWDYEKRLQYPVNINITNNSFELLWTNNNPNSDFATQTIPLNLSDYDGVLIFTKSSAGNSIV